MEWKELSVRDRANFIHQFVKGGIITIKEQEDFYNNVVKSQGHKFDGDPSKEDVRAAEMEQAFKNAMKTRSFVPYFGQTSGFSFNIFPNSFQKQEDANVPMSWGVSLDVPVVKAAKVGAMPNDPHDDYYGSLNLYAKNAYPNGFSWDLSGNYTKGGTTQDDVASLQGGVGYRHIPTGLFGEFSAGYNKKGNPLQPQGFTTSGSVGYRRNIGEKQELKRQKAEALLQEIAEERRLQEQE